MFPPIGGCNGTVTFQPGTTLTGSGTFQTYLGAPPSAPHPIPTASNGAQPTALMFTQFTLTSGSSISIPANDNSPDLTFHVATTVGCTTYYELFGGSLIGWQGYGAPGVVTGTTIDFAPSKNGGSTDLSSGQTYYVGIVCV